MAIDDHPVEALRQQFALEDSSATPFGTLIMAALQSLPLPYPLDRGVDRLKDCIAADATHRIRIMVEVCADELIQQSKDLRTLESRLEVQEEKQKTQAASELLLDASRRAAVTRSLDRVKRIGLILASGLLANPIDSDETEEMMRIAMELSDQDVLYLRDLVNLEGARLKEMKRIERYDAHTRWEQGPWGTKPDGNLDSAFSKLESYGLVSRLAPPNNHNIMSDFQNRYVLLQKGLRFADSIQKSVEK